MLEDIIKMKKKRSKIEDEIFQLFIYDFGNKDFISWENNKTTIKILGFFSEVVLSFDFQQQKKSKNHKIKAWISMLYQAWI